MLKKFKIKNLIAIVLVTVMVVTVFSPTVLAEEMQPTMPDLSEYSFITIDEIEPQTSVGNLLGETSIEDVEEIKVYDSQGYLLANADYVGNGATIVVSENQNITEVYKVKLYGDLNCDGRINAADLASLKQNLLNATSAFDDTVTDITADGDCNVLDLVKLKKNQSGSAQISQNRMFAYSSRFNWLDSMELTFNANGYAEAFEDFSVVSNDIDITFSRYYDSSDISSGIFGVGWTASFEGSCSLYENNSRLIKIYGQAPVVFEFANGKYVCDYSRATLTTTNNGFIFVGEDGLTYLFNQNGYLVSITDRNNNSVNITVDSNGKIQKVTDSVGREFLYTYGQNGLLSDITDCINRTVNYTYDASNRLSSVIGVMGTVTEQYEYNTNNKLSKVSDAFGNRITEIAYADNGTTVSSITDSEGVATNYSYNTQNNSVTVSQNDTVIEENVYNRYNYLISSSTEDGLQQNFYCNSYGDVAVCLDTDESKVLYAYDGKGNATKIITETEDETLTEINKYDSDGNILSSVTDTESTLYTYDDNGNTLSVTKTDEKDTEISEYTYYENGLIKTSKVDNVTASYCYDNKGFLNNETDTEGNSKNYNYNSVGWLLSESDEENTINYVYNKNGDTLRETKNNTVKTRTVYDNYGRIKQQIGETEYNSAYDGLNTSPYADSYLNSGESVQSGIRYFYGEDGKLAQISASCYTVATDSSQKVTSVSAGNTVLAEYNYTNDAKELLSSVEYANGQDIKYYYDEKGNVSLLYYGDTLAAIYNYNADDSLKIKVNTIENIRTDYTEDTVTVSKINADQTLTELYSYSNQKLMRHDLPLGVVGEPDFTEADEDEEPDLERVTESFNDKSFSTDYYENRIEYGALKHTTSKNDEDAVSKINIKNGSKNVLSTEYSYNEDSLPTSISNIYKQFGSNYYYTCDENGNIESVTKKSGNSYSLEPTELEPADYQDGILVSNSEEKRYYYDALGQLIRVDDEEANTTTEYLYNGTSGNITAVKTYALYEKDAELGTPTATKTFGYAQSGWTDLLTSVDGSPLTYDSLGNLLTYNGYTYTWEAGRRLTQMTNGTNTYNYKYDDNGIRTEKTINGVTTHYTTVDGRITGQYYGNNTLYFRYDANNSLIGFNLNGTEYIYLKNIQGDIDGILDTNGNLVVKYTYDAWGKVLSVTGELASTVGIINPMRYRGYYLDIETGYYYLQSRYYNPDICRFINADEPVLTILGENSTRCNLFEYCFNNPIRFLDNSGNLAIESTIFFIGLCATLIGILSSYISTPQFKSSWASFCATVGNGLSWIGNSIVNGGYDAWSWTKNQIKSASDAISKYITIASADAKIMSKVKRNSKNRYWAATISKISGYTYVIISSAISYSVAKSRVASGLSVFTVTKAEARRLAANFPPVVGPEKGLKDAGQYMHYHVRGRKNKSHILFLF